MSEQPLDYAELKEASEELLDAPGGLSWMRRRDALREECALGEPHAVQFLMAMGLYVELWDDLIDKDKPISDEMIHSVMAAGLLDVATNPWVQAHRDFIAPTLVMMINNYLTSEELKTDPDVAVRQRAFHLRNFPLELYGVVAFLQGGMHHMRAMDPKIRRFFAFERFEDWEHADG